MADYGLLGGIGQGLQQGLLMYQKTKQLNRENQIQNLTSGVQQDADGNLSLTPLKQQQQQMQQTQADEFGKSHDATTQQSQDSRSFHRQALAKAVPGIDVMKAIPDTMSKADLESESSPIKGLIQGGFGMQGNQARAAGMNGRVLLGQDNQAEAAVQKVHKDPLIVQMRGQANNIDKGLNLLSDPKNPPSMTAMNEVAQDMAAALSGNKGVASDFKVKAVSTPTIEGKMQELKAYMSSDPNQPAPPDVVAFWKDMGTRLQGAYDRQMGQRANNLTQGSKTAFAHNPNAANAMQEAAATYKSGKWREDGIDSSQDTTSQIAPGQPGATNQQYTPDVLDYAKTHNITPDQANAIKAQRTGGAPQSPQVGATSATSGLLGKLKGLVGG